MYARYLCVSQGYFVERSMAIKTVNSENLAEYVASRTPNAAGLQTAAQITAEVVAKQPAAEPKKDDPVVSTGEETVSTAPDPGEQEPSAKKGPKPVQPRIDELTREKKELEEFAQSEYESRQQAERRIVELEEQIKAAAPPKVHAEPELVEPDPAKYTDQAAFNKDWKEYQRKVIASEVRSEFQAAQAAEQQRRLDELLTERVELARKEIPDFDSVIKSRDQAKRNVPAHIVAAIRESALGPQLAYHLAKHPEEEARIYKLTPAAALLALGKIEMDYEPKAESKAQAEPEPKVITKPAQTRAPAPITPLKGEGGAIPEDLSGPLPFKEYQRRRIQEMRANRR